MRSGHPQTEPPLTLLSGALKEGLMIPSRSLTCCVAEDDPGFLNLLLPLPTQVLGPQAYSTMPRLWGAGN